MLLSLIDLVMIEVIFLPQFIFEEAEKLGFQGIKQVSESKSKKV
jgi:hypothetical protein